MNRNIIFRIFKTALKLTCAMALTNAAVSLYEQFLQMISEKRTLSYPWKYGRVSYTVKGTGSPILLLHDLTPSATGEDMAAIANHLATTHTVYTVDLPGYGFSEKPWLTYTNFVYVTFIRDFIKDVIGEPAGIYARKGSCLIALQAKHFLKDDVPSLVMIDPCYEEKISFPKDAALKLQKVIEIPLYGTFIFHVYGFICGFPASKCCKHVFTALLTGHITTDISKYHHLIGSKVSVMQSTSIRSSMKDFLNPGEIWVSNGDTLTVK